MHSARNRSGYRYCQIVRCLELNLHQSVDVHEEIKLSSHFLVRSNGCSQVPFLGLSCCQNRRRTATATCLTCAAVTRQIDIKGKLNHAPVVGWVIFVSDDLGSELVG